MTFHYRYRKQIVICLIILIGIASLVTLGVVKYYKKEKKPSTTIASIIKKDKNNNPDNKKEQNKPNKNAQTLEKGQDNTKMYKVDIKGQVNNPGIYTLKAESRVIDVIEVAGGLTGNANTSVINLSKKIFDEMVIIVYSNEEVADFAKTKEQEAIIQEKCQQKDENALKNDACICEETPNDTKLLSINKATLEEFTKLPGIGEAKAQDIINYREANGEFKSIEDLKNISGIGESIFAKIKDLITL